MTRAVLEEFGRVDILVNNAYGAAPGHYCGILDQPEGLWEESLQGNLFGPYELAKAFAPSMLATGSGAIVNLVSAAAYNPIWGRGAYGVAKAALGQYRKMVQLGLGDLDKSGIAELTFKGRGPKKSAKKKK